MVIFLLRSAFWLGLVFWILGPRNVDFGTHDLQTGVDSATELAAGAASQMCRGDRLAACLTAASTLTHLVADPPHPRALQRATGDTTAVPNAGAHKAVTVPKS